jgi:hypothetical protein
MSTTNFKTFSGSFSRYWNENLKYFFFRFFLVEIWFKNDISIKNMSCLTLNPTSVNNHNAHMHAISTQLVYHQCLMCIFDVNTSTPLKIEKLQQKGARHTFNLFFLSSWFLFICSTYSSVHHGFSSYHQAFLDFLLGFSSYV